MPSQCWAYWHQVKPASSDVLRTPVAGLWGSWESTGSFSGASQTFKAALRGSETWASRQLWRQPRMHRQWLQELLLHGFLLFCADLPQGRLWFSGCLLLMHSAMLATAWILSVFPQQDRILHLNFLQVPDHSTQSNRMRRNCLDRGGVTYITAGSQFYNAPLKAFSDLYYSKECIMPLGVWPKEMNIHVPQKTHKRMSIAALYAIFPSLWIVGWIHTWW